MPKQNVAHRVQRRVESRVPRFFTAQVAVLRPGVQVPQLLNTDRRGAAILQARYRRQEHADVTVPREVGLLRFCQTGKRTGEAVDPVSGRELHRHHPDTAD